MAELSSNAVPFEVLSEEESVDRIGLELVAYGFADPFTPLDVLPYRFDLKILDEIAGPGGGSFRVYRSDEKVIESPNLLDYRNVFKVLLDQRVVGAFVNTQKRTDYVSKEERAGAYWECSGGGLREWFHDAVVEPYGGIRSDSQTSRAFSFASERGHWYKPSDWLSPAVIQAYALDPNNGPFGTAPAEWPDASSAQWIWGQANDATSNPAPEGMNYFRYEFDISSAYPSSSYSVFVAAKDYFDVYVDAQLVIESHEDNGYAQTWRADFTLTPGHHILAVRVKTTGRGAAGLIAALFRAGDAAAETAAELLTVTGMTTTAAYDARIVAAQALQATAQAALNTANTNKTTAQSVVDAAQAKYDGLSAGTAKDAAATALEVKQIKLDEAIEAVTTAEAALQYRIDDVDSLVSQKASLVASGAFDTPWLVNAYPDPAPGWTPGEVMITLLNEANARGVRFPSWLTPTFTETEDSAGQTWTRALDWSFDLGTEYYDVIEKLEELVCDLWVDPTTYELHMWAERGVHRDTQSQAVQPIKFEIGRNVTKAGSEGTSDIKNTLLMSTEDGWQLLQDGLTPSLATYGRVEGYVSTGASSNVSGDLAVQIFLQRAKPEISATYEIVDVDDARPFFDFQAGDWVLAPSEEDEDTLESRRVMSISVSENNDTGYPDFALEFDTITEDVTRRYERWLKTSSDGTLGGTLANVSTSGGGGGGTPTTQTAQSGPQGLQGAKGPEGPRGPQGYPGVDGKSFTWRGAWSAGTTYAAQDVVVYNGVAYVALQISINQSPTSGAPNWAVISSKGDTGQTGQGLTWKGAWATSTAYDAYDIAEHLGSAYICTTTHNSAASTEPSIGASWTTRWALIVRKGDTGEVGPRGPAGANLVILGTLESEDDLPTTGAAGDAYLIDGHLFIWSVLLGEWEDVGSFGGSGGGGSSSGGGGGYAAGNFVKTTTVIQDGQTFKGDFPFNGAEVSQALMVSADAPCRVRFYATQEQQDADEWRPLGIDPLGNHGVLLDALLVPSRLSVVLSPAAILFNATNLLNPVRVTITNMTGTERTLTVTVLTKGLPGAALGGTDAATYVKSTGTLAHNASEQTSFTMSSAELHQALVLSANVPCRIRFYASPAQRTADLSRVVGVDPVGDQGVLLDMELKPGKLEYVLAPSVALFSTAGFGDVPVTITNKSGSSGTVTVSLTAKGI